MKDLRTTNLLRRLMLAVAVFSLTTTALADDISIPTTTENPFDLTRGVITSNDTHQHFTNNGLEWMIDGDHITFTLQNEQDVDYYFVTVNADTGNNGVTIDFSLKTEKDDAVADTTFSIENRGWYQASPYQTKTPAMKKGRYTLTLTFHSSPGNTTGNVKSISFKPSMYNPVPTTADNPFDLSLGFLEGRGLSINNANEIDNGRNGYRATFGIDNTEDVDYYLLSFKAGTTRNDAQFHITVTAADGTKVYDQTVPLTNNGTWTANRMYAVKTAAMKKGRYTVVFDFISTGNEYAARLADIAFNAPPQAIAIPTDDDHPFDLTKAFVFSSTTNKHFTDYGVEYMYNDNQLIYTVQCQDDLDVCNVYVGSDTQFDEVSLDLSLKDRNDKVVAETTWQIANTGWYKPAIYDLKLHQLKKGRYTLTLTFHQSHHTNWSACNIGSIAFKKPLNLKPGDNVDLVNAEFDNGFDGWERKGNVWNALEEFGNKYCLAHFNMGTGFMSQTVYNLPDGTYLLRMNAYDSTPNWNGTDSLGQDTYLFLNDRMVLMKTAYADANGYRNIYRWYEGKDNSSYRRTTDGRFMPTHQVQWNESLNMFKRLYMNSVVTTITNGQASFGWKKTDNRATRIPFDHVQLIYLSDKTNVSTTELANLEREQTTAYYQERLSELEEAIRTELAAKRAHAPQAIIEANGAINTDIAYNSDNEIIEAILRLEHLLQRLQLPFYDITLGSPGTLADLLNAAGIQTTDTIALKLDGTLNDEDLATLKTLKSIIEIDLSATTLTALPEAQFMQMRLLTWVTLPKNLETMGNSVFNGCYELRDLQLPATLKSVGDYCFRYTYNFYRADIPEGLTVNNGAYRNSGIRHLTLPTSMKEVPYICFSDCYDLLDIQFNKQETIGQEAFANCYSLMTLELPEGIQRFKSGSFRGCSGLTKATLPSTTIWVEAPFFNCRNLKDLTCLAAAPPYPSNQSIHGDSGSEGCTLYVAQQSVDDYQEADRWKDFNVVGIDTLPATVNIISGLIIDLTESLPAGYKPNVSFTALYGYWGGNVDNVPTYGHLTVNGTATFSANQLKTLWNPFALRSTAARGNWLSTYTSLINNGQIRADNITIDLRLYENCWEFISFPFDVRVGDIRYQFPDVPLVIYGYDAQKRAEGKNSETWVKMTADSILHAGRGYIWQTTIPADQIDERAERVGGDFNYQYNGFYIDALQNANKPKFFRTDDVEVKLDRYHSEFAHDRSWNLIGNPYPCYFDIQKIETTAPLVVWRYTTSYGGQYQAYSPLDDDLILFPGQAFFIQRPLDQESVVFHREGRQHDLKLHYDVEQARVTRAATKSRQVYNLLLSGKTEILDRTRFVINEAATLDYEQGRDASKFFSLDASAAHLYIIRNGVRYAIDERPLDNGTIQLGLKTAAEGTYTISLGTSHTAKQNGNITLFDHETGTKTDLTTGSYTFLAKAGTTDSRFTIYLGGVTAVQSVATESQTAEQLYDLQGRPVTNPQSGIYVRNNKKVIIK